MILPGFGSCCSLNFLSHLEILTVVGWTAILFNDLIHNVPLLAIPCLVAPVCSPWLLGGTNATTEESSSKIICIQIAMIWYPQFPALSAISTDWNRPADRDLETYNSQMNHFAASSIRDKAAYHRDLAFQRAIDGFPALIMTWHVEIPTIQFRAHNSYPSLKSKPCFQSQAHHPVAFQCSPLPKGLSSPFWKKIPSEGD